MKTEILIYQDLKSIVEPIHAHEGQLLAIAKYINREYQEKDRTQAQNYDEIIAFIVDELKADYTISGGMGRCSISLKKSDFKIQVPISSFSNLASFKHFLTEELKNWATSKGDIFTIDLFKNYKLH